MVDLFNGLKNWYKNSEPRSRLVAGLFVFSLLATSVFFIMSGSTSVASSPMDSVPLYFFSALIKLVGVLLLIVLCAALYKRWINIGVGSGKVRQLKVLETVRLTPRQTLYLITVGDQQLLIGATDQNISLLSPIDSNFSQELAVPTSSQSEMNFGSIIQSFGSNSPAEPPAGKD